MSLGLSGGTIASIAGAGLGLLNSGSGGQAQQTQTASKEPWAAAAPWLTSQLQTGQNLQNYYQQNPFNAQQQQAYTNQAGNSDYARQLVASVLGQGQAPAFDRNNPSAKPQAYQIPAFTGALSAGNGGAGAAGTSNASLASPFTASANPFMNGAIPQTPATTPDQSMASQLGEYEAFRQAGGTASRESFNALYGGINPYKSMNSGSDPTGR